MSLYAQLRRNPPKLEVPDNTTEMKIHLVSCMCDNKYLISLYKSNHRWTFDTGGQAVSNFQLKYYKYEIERAADENNWNKVFSLINSGTEVIEKIVSR